MVKIKGVYEWELREQDGSVVDSGKEENMITDHFFELILNNCYLENGFQQTSDTRGAIVISTTSAVSGVDYRVLGAAAARFAETAVASYTDFSFDYTNQRMYVSNQFNLPGGDRTIYTIGCHFNPYYKYNDAGLSVGSTYTYYEKWGSLVNLTTPITQTTTQYFYVRYYIYLEFVGSGGNYASNSDFVIQSVNADGELLNRTFCIFGTNMGTPPDTYPEYHTFVANSFFKPPQNINYLERPPQYETNFSNKGTNVGSRNAWNYQKSYDINEGTAIFGTQCYITNGRIGYQNDKHGLSIMLGYFPDLSANNCSVSRVYVHPDSRKTVNFSDPTYPPDSKGQMTVVSTSAVETTLPMKVAIVIDKTGEASDFIDETFTADDATDILTITQSWETDDIVTLETTDTLPSPLTSGTQYYIISAGIGEIQLTSAAAGTAINITDAGTGTHTIKRYKNATFHFETIPYYNSKIKINNLSYAMDLDGTRKTDYIRNQEESIETNAQFIDSPVNMFRTSGSSDIYTIQTDNYYTDDTEAASLQNIRGCVWNFPTIETSQAIFSATGTYKSSTQCLGNNDNLVFVVTDEGLFKWDISTSATALSGFQSHGISGISATDTLIDVVVDEMIDDSVWLAFDLGFYYISLSANSATRYDNTSLTLSGIPTSYFPDFPGQFSVRNNQILKATVCEEHYGLFSTSNRYLWLAEKDVGWYVFNSDPANNQGTAACFEKDSGYIISSQYWTGPYYRVRTYDVHLSGGSNSGSVDIINEVNVGNGGSTYYHISKLAYIGNKHVIGLGRYYTGFNYYDRLIIINYDGSGGFTHLTLSYANTTFMTRSQRYWINRYQLPSIAAAFDQQIDLSPNSDKTAMYCKFGQTLYSYDNGRFVPFYWTGSNWERYDNLEESQWPDFGTRYIPETGIVDLPNGMQISFNNAIGESWDTQFVDTERFTVVYGYGHVKDNLQQYQLNARWYYCDARNVEDFTLSAVTSATSIPETSAYDFRDMDTASYCIDAYDETTAAWLTLTTTTPNSGEFYPTSAGIIYFHADEIGNNIRMNYNYTLRN